MDTKIFVFSRKEVALIFLIVFTLTVTSFALGVKFGTRYYLELAGIQDVDRQEVEMKSVQEENVEEVMIKKESNDSESNSQTNLMHEQLKEKISNELDENKAEKEEVTDIDGLSSNDQAGDTEEITPKKDMLEQVNDKLPAVDQYSGKYTIKVSSHISLKEAEEFANGFKIRGYNPIINEIQSRSTGTTFRVSLGVFDTISEAKEYVLKEKSLFEGQDYHFEQFE